MKKILKKIIIVMVLIALIIIPYRYVWADVGSFESYDSGGWDSGSSWDSWDSGSSWDSYDYYDDYYYYSGGYPSFYSIMFVIVICAGIIVGGIVKNKYMKDGNYTPNYNKTSIENINEDEIEKQIKQVDELFNKDDFKSWAKDLFIKLQYAWTARDWSVIRCFETNELFELHSTQLQGYIDRKQINVLERVAVNTAKLYKFRQSGDKDIIEILLNSKMIDYIIDEDTQKVLKGSKDRNIYSTYKLTFIRKTGVKTKAGETTVNTTNCPNCGAPTKITSSGKCEYCGSIITTGEYDWVLSGLERFMGY